MSTKIKMTENEFIEKFKKHGFELYETKSIKPKLEVYYLLISVLEKIGVKCQCKKC